MSLYFHINLVLLSAFLFFVVIRWALSHIKINIRNQSLVRLSQTLILLSILAPITLSFTPEKQLPSFKFQLLNKFSEEVDIGATIHKVVTTTQKVTTRNLQDSNHPRNAFDLNVVLTVWLFGFLLFSFLTLKSFFRLNRILNNAIPFKRIGQVQIAVSETISVPFSARLYKTKWVIIPLVLLSKKKDFTLALKHELQHHRQVDTLWAVWIEILRCIFYLNPAIYFWKNLVIELQEFSCDEALLGQRGVSAREYGSCLVRVAETALESREMHVGTTCMAAVSKNPMVFKSLLKRRIEMIMKDKKSSNKLAGSLIGTITILFTVAIAYGAEQSSRNGINPGIAQVDEAIQKIADQVLSKAIKDEDAEAGFAIVADPNTGRVLAVANIDTKSKRKGHWALSEQSEAASLMKGITVAEALEQGVTTPASEHNCENGVYQFGGHTFHDWKKVGYEKLSTTQTIALSSDICSMKIAEKLGAEKLHSMFAHYGFGSDGTAKQFPEARVGQSPALDTGKYSELIPTAAYGMGFNSTPIEVLQAYGAIANGGNLLQPKLANASDEKPQIIRRVLSEDNAKKMREMLQQVVLVGTASRISADGIYTMAGKTKSSYTGGVIEGDSTGGQFKTNIAGFVGFAPVTNPRVEIYVQIFRPADPTGAHGSTHAAPVFATLANQILKHMNVVPDKQKL